jgi:hypothetical protein
MPRSDDSGFYDVSACCKWGVPLYLNAAGKVERWLSGKLGQCSGLPVYDRSTTMSPSAGESNSLYVGPMGFQNATGSGIPVTAPDQVVTLSLQTMLRVSPFFYRAYQLDAATGDRYLGLSVAAASCMDCVA